MKTESMMAAGDPSCGTIASSQTPSSNVGWKHLINLINMCIFKHLTLMLFLTPMKRDSSVVNNMARPESSCWFCEFENYFYQQIFAVLIWTQI